MTEALIDQIDKLYDKLRSVERNDTHIYINKTCRLNLKIVYWIIYFNYHV